MVTGEMGEQLRVYAALPEDLNSVPDIHIRHLTTNCDSSSRGSVSSTGLCRYSITCTCKQIHDRNKIFK